jgi:two-component system, NarL family, response regulator NreC
VALYNRLTSRRFLSSERSLPTTSPMIRTRVLLADDHPSLLAAIGRLIATNGNDVVGSVENGGRLLDEAIRLQPDIIVVDLHMPDLNGLEACRELTRLLPRTRIIVISAEDDADVKRVVLAAGAFAFIEKAIVATDLLPALRAAGALGTSGRSY